jgi:dTDP-4-amino-4,6-dideoxygalactose transaminase
VKTIPVMAIKPVSFDLLRPRIESIHRSGVFSNRGGQLKELEARLAGFLGVAPNHVVAVSNGTVALSAAVAASAASEWLVQNWTFPATLLAPLGLSRKVQLLDIDSETWDLRSKGLGPTQGLITVPVLGAKLELKDFDSSQETVVDAAASLPVSQGALSGLGMNFAVTFSLHATKLMGGAEGGLVVFGSSKRADFARSWINFGFNGRRVSEILGVNGKMSEYDAAVANARLDGWDQEKPQWLLQRDRAILVEKDLGLFGRHGRLADLSPYWVVKFENPRQKLAVAASLSKAQIGWRDWWGRGLHQMPAFRTLSNGSFSNSEKVADSTIGLPFFWGMTDSQFLEISKAIKTGLRSV